MTAAPTSRTDHTPERHDSSHDRGDAALVALVTDRVSTRLIDAVERDAAEGTLDRLRAARP